MIKNSWVILFQSNSSAQVKILRDILRKDRRKNKKSEYRNNIEWLSDQEKYKYIIPASILSYRSLFSLVRRVNHIEVAGEVTLLRTVASSEADSHFCVWAPRLSSTIYSRWIRAWKRSWDIPFSRSHSIGLSYQIQQ